MIEQRILIIDNDVDTLFLLGNALTKVGYIVETCTTASGIVEFKHTLPDLFIIDQGLPTIDGIAVSKFVRLHESTKNIPIIMISGQQIKNRAKKAGIDEFIKKPFQLDHLL
jgi:DNA-binding response OmpR family regulator